ncbi:endonuclease [Candidatus Falkowbacteria bacterium CG10_big_fil_rev_8_21_14_0_10_43_10]|uniref:Endonuclease n=1 Tax=Candidatus Falkowbacteria bacterium CG10_big_fil_rev_8_21_14_0_10_43_10 TaxID=1974567 RepID=A0A2H0V2C2_9BACT|nr:MAG: endonuclease [Candidatus Falkowbacteria bacterium CG10_big_fil_rev_8_21_14_0_10_43_10]
MFYVYVIINEENKIYIGQTSNLEERLKRHNSVLKNKKTSYTSKNRCVDWKLIHKELYDNKSETMRREKQLKSYKGREFIRSLLNIAPIDI